MKRTGRGSGFTMAELLIVIVILGVMASLVMPRFFGQTRQARIAEALQMISALRPLAINYLDSRETYMASLPGSAAGCSHTAEQWERFGMSRQENASKYFEYRICAAEGIEIVAMERLVPWVAEIPLVYGDNELDSMMSLTITLGGVETWTCTGVFQPVYATPNNTATPIIGCSY